MKNILLRIFFCNMSQIPSFRFSFQPLHRYYRTSVCLISMRTQTNMTQKQTYLANNLTIYLILLIRLDLATYLGWFLVITIRCPKRNLSWLTDCAYFDTKFASTALNINSTAGNYGASILFNVVRCRNLYCS